LNQRCLNPVLMGRIMAGIAAPRHDRRVSNPRDRRTHRRLLRCALGLGLLGSVLSASAAPVILFDGALGTRPDQQGWAWLTNPFFAAQATRAAAGDATTLDSTPLIGEMAGWFANFPPLPRHPNLPTLDRAAGYRVQWDLLMLSESHVSNDRAGFSVIVLGDDLRGVEIGFWPDEVWIQADAPLFTHGEGVAFDTTRARTRYALAVKDDRYELFADGTPLVAGALRDYSSFGAPYDIPDFVFLGDDTGSGATRAQLARVEICTAAGAASPGDSLRLTREGQDILLDVAATGALEYRIYRDLTAAGAGTTLHVAGPLPPLRDAASIPDGGTWYFVARAVDDCGGEHD
jgi:hypothetical protein